MPIVSDEVYYKQVYPGVESESFGDLTEDVPVIVLSGYVIPLSKSIKNIVSSRLVHLVDHCVRQK